MKNSTICSWPNIDLLQTEVISAKYVMKTDDDAFVRVDEILISLNRMNASHGLLYGLINSDSQPHRNPDSKWYISPEVPFFSNDRKYIIIQQKYLV